MIKAVNLEALRALFISGAKKANDKQPIIATFEEKRDDGKLWIHFQIENSKGGFYNCFVGQTLENDFWVACQCYGGLHEKACYHGYTALESYIKRLSELGKAEMKEAPYFSGGESSKDKPIKVGKIGGI